MMLRTAKLSLRASQRKLKLLGLRTWQIKRMMKRQKPSVYTNVYAPAGGIVTHKKAKEGMYVKTGDPLYTIADLSQVWVRFDAYERQLPWLVQGQRVTFETQAAPGKSFSGNIVYIDPIMNTETRTVHVRMNVANQQGLLKPGMFVRGYVHVSVNAKGYAQKPQTKGQWSCPMHPEIVRKKRSRCPLCGMKLEKRKIVRQSQSQDPWSFREQLLY